MKQIVIVVVVLCVGFFLGFIYKNIASDEHILGSTTTVTTTPIIYCNTKTPCPSGTVCKFEHICPSAKPNAQCLSLVCEKP